MSAWTIRPAELRDRDAIAELHVKVWRDTYAALAPAEAVQALGVERRREHWDDLLSRGKESLTLVAVAGEVAGDDARGALIGFGHAATATHPALSAAGEIVHLYIDPDHQGLGVGSVLLRDMAAFLAERGHRDVRLAVVKGNDAAIGFYERHGGVCVGEYVDGVLWRSTNLIIEWPVPSVPVGSVR